MFFFFFSFQSPIKLLLQITIPLVRHDVDSWNRPLNCFQVLIGPLWCTVLTKSTYIRPKVHSGSWFKRLQVSITRRQFSIFFFTVMCMKVSFLSHIMPNRVSYILTYKVSFVYSKVCPLSNIYD